MKNLVLVLSAMIFAGTVQAREKELFWADKSVNLEVTSSQPSSFQQTFLLEKVLRIYSNYECGYYVDPVTQVRPGTCYDVQCSGGAGKSEAWNAFYSARKEEKAARLAEAIKGIGQKTAEKLLAGNYFSSKPRSWDDFKAVINQAKSNGTIDDQIRTLVLSTYRNENMQNLGYNPSSCTTTAYDCSEIIVIRDGYYQPQTCERYDDTVVDAKSVNYQFQVEGAVLLPGEKDVLSLKVNAPGSLAIAQQGAHNNYQAVMAEGSSESQVYYYVKGVARKQVDLPSSALARADLFPAGKQAVQLQVSVSALALPQAANEELVLQYEVRSCKVGWLGVCGLGWDKKETKTTKLTSATTPIDVKINLEPGRKGLKVEVQVSISKRNSVYHTPKAIVKTTETIKL